MKKKTKNRIITDPKAMRTQKSSSLGETKRKATWRNRPGGRGGKFIKGLKPVFVPIGFLLLTL